MTGLGSDVGYFDSLASSTLERELADNCLFAKTVFHDYKDGGFGFDCLGRNDFAADHMVFFGSQFYANDTLGVAAGGSDVLL